jgi:mono/diheme cytochrome c family protein
MLPRTSRPLTILLSLSLLLLAAFTVSACSVATPADTWVKPNQNEANTRYTGGRISTSTVNNLAVGWTADQRTRAGFGSLAPSPFVTQNNVFVQAPTGNIVGFDLQTGALSAGVQSPAVATRLPSWVLAWASGRLRTLASSISPILTRKSDETRIAVGAAGDRVVALYADKGAKTWSRQIDSKEGTSTRVISNMAAAHDTIYVPVADISKQVTATSVDGLLAALKVEKRASGRLVALNVDNGKVNWTKQLSSPPLGAATVVNDIVFTSTLDGHVYGFNASNGDEVWSSPLPAGAVAPIAAYSGTLVVPAGFVTKRGQKAQVVAFTIGGLGSIGGAAAPKIKQQQQGAVAEQSTGEQSGGEQAAGPDGKTLFTENCAGCHTLQDAGTAGTSGPDLDTLKPSAAVVDKQVTNGGAVMPPFKGKLTPEEIQAIADYVASVAGK